MTPEEKAALEAENAQLKTQLAEAAAREKTAAAIAVRAGTADWRAWLRASGTGAA